VITKLRCPVCRLPLQDQTTALRCAGRHSFNRAKQGYVDLTAGPVTHDGDTAEMVASRESLQAAGHLDFITDAIASVLPATAQGLAVEVGAGTGYHLARTLDARPDLHGLAVDVAKPALRRAARAHPRMAAIRADVWRGLPIADGAATVVLNVFAPRSGAEFGRILDTGGVLVVVTPEPDHLSELVDALGLLRVDPDKPDRLRATLAPWFEPGPAARFAVPLKLSHVDAAALAAMGPSAHHLDAATLEARLRTLPEPFATTAAVRLCQWRTLR
jgi:23S rRNA (guanine745-N1)-methyltransferase